MRWNFAAACRPSIVPPPATGWKHRITPWQLVQPRRFALETFGYRWRSRLKRPGRRNGGASGGARVRPEPVAHTSEVDRGRGRHMLQVGYGQPAVAAAAEREGAPPRGGRPLDPGPPRVAAPALLRREPLPGGLERLVLGPRLQLQVPGLVRGPGAQRPSRAGGAVRLTEPGRDVGGAGLVELRAPGRGQLALRAAHPLLVPVDVEPVDRVAALDLALPGRVRPRRAEQLDAQLLAATDQQLGVDVGRVHQVLPRRQTLAGQGLVDRGRAPGLVDGGNRRHRVGEEIDLVVLAGLGEVDDVAGPRGTRAGAEARLRVVRGLDRLR